MRNNLVIKFVLFSCLIFQTLCYDLKQIKNLNVKNAIKSNLYDLPPISGECFGGLLKVFIAVESEEEWALKCKIFKKKKKSSFIYFVFNFIYSF
jgi:hypothetical protein